MKTIESRKDVNRLVKKFYAKIRKDEMLGSIFNSHIAEDEWPAHLEKLTDFWETNLFGVRKFKGNPVQKHVNVDRNLNYGVEQTHFGQWLHLWFETIDELYDCERAERAKRVARKMATGQFLMIWNHRPEEVKSNL